MDEELVGRLNEYLERMRVGANGMVTASRDLLAVGEMLAADVDAMEQVVGGILELGVTREVPVLGQRDPSWGGERLGTSNVTIAEYGCVVTCLAMLLRGYGLSENPATVNWKLTMRNGFYNRNLVIWESVGRIWPELEWAGRVNCATTPAPVARINAELAARRPVIVLVDFSYTPGLQQHFVLLVDELVRDDGIVDWVCHDPWYADLGSLVERYRQVVVGKPWMLSGEGIVQGARFYRPVGRS